MNSTKKNKVLFCTGTGDIDQWCGVSQSTFLIASHLKRYEASFVTTGPYGISDKLKENNIPLTNIPFYTKKIQAFGKSGLVAKMRIFASLAAYWLKVFSFLKREEISLIYCATLSAAFLYILPAKILGCKVILAIRGEPSNARHWGWFYKWSDKILPLSKDLEQIVLGHPANLSGNFNEKCQVISNGIPLPENLEVGANDLVTLLYIGVFDERKGQLDFIKRVFPLIKEKCLILFAGSAKREKDKAYEEACHASAQELSNENKKIEFLGFVSNIDQLYRKVDIVLLASKSEGQPRTVIEGMAYAKPVVSYKVTSVKALLSDNEAGYVVDNGDAPAMAEKIDVLIKDRHLRLSMGKQGRQFVLDHISIDSISKKHESVFDGLLKNRQTDR